MVRQITIEDISLIGSVRESNEDVHYFKINLDSAGDRLNENLAPIDLFILCDGHGGDSVSKFCCVELRKALFNPELVWPITFTKVKNIYNTIQAKIANHPQNIGQMCGTTALVIVRYLNKVGKDFLQVINLGDSRAIICNDFLAVPLTLDHKPMTHVEKIRIKKLNTELKNKKNTTINFHDEQFRIGTLSVSRAFGDIMDIPGVSNEPMIDNIKLLDKHKFIVMACDGLWDVMDNQSVVDFVLDHMTNSLTSYYDLPLIMNGIEVKHCQYYYNYPHNNNKKSIARKLAEYAISLGSSDNISIIIIVFKK
jgi:serine/threonine protein phosphatase PrpC